MDTRRVGTTVAYMKKEFDVEEVEVNGRQLWSGGLETIKEENDLPVLLSGGVNCLEELLKLEPVNSFLTIEPEHLSLLDNPLLGKEGQENGEFDFLDSSVLQQLVDFGLPADVPSYKKFNTELNLDESSLEIEGVDFNLPDNPLFKDLQQELCCELFDQPLSSNSAETASLESPPFLYLPSNSSQSEEIFQRDIILANHPLIPHLQTLLQGSLSENPPLEILSNNPPPEILSGIGEADDVLQEAVRLAILLPRHDDETFEGIAQSILGETTGFCQRLLNGDETCVENFSTENDANAINCKGQPTQFVGKIKSSVPGKKRSKLSDKASKILREWLFEHSHRPYPDDDQKDELCLRTNLTISQLNNWFINARRRILQPHLRANCIPI